MIQSDVFSNAEIMEIMLQRPADGAKYLKRASLVRRVLREANDEVSHYQEQLEESIRARDADVDFVQSCCDHVFFEGKCVCCGAS